MKERSLTSTWRGPCFRKGGQASSAHCVESKTHKRSMFGITLKVFTFRVTSATIVTTARKHSRTKMLCAFMFLWCTEMRKCDVICLWLLLVQPSCSCDYIAHQLFRINGRNLCDFFYCTNRFSLFIKNLKGRSKLCFRDGLTDSVTTAVKPLEYQV